jgi:hypothetical protein
LTKVGFGNGGHCSKTITNLSHSHWALAWARITTFWSFHLCMAMASPKIQTFILACSWHQRPFSKIESLLVLTFFATKPCTSFKCLVINHFTTYVLMQM